MFISRNECFHPITSTSNKIPPTYFVLGAEDVVAQTQSTIPNEEDPLIDRQWERIDYMGIFLMVILLIIGFGLLSRQIGYALIAAALITLVIVGIILL